MSTDLNISFSTTQLASDLRKPERQLNSKIELVISIFENTDFAITIVIDVHDTRD